MSHTSKNYLAAFINHGTFGATRWQNLFVQASLVGLILSFTQTSIAAEVIEFADDELAKESVLPVFDKTVVVRERTIKTAGRFEFGVGAGLNLVEPLYEQFVYNFTASYHIDELHGVNLIGYFLSTELSEAGKDLQAGKGLVNRRFDASVAPQVESMFFANYQFTAYYGKLSVTRQSVMNLSLYGLIGGGLVQWTDKTGFGLDAGVGQKLYINKNLSLRFDLLLAMYQGPDPTSPKTTDKKLDPGPDMKSGQFDSTLYFRPFLTGSLIYLF